MLDRCLPRIRKLGRVGARLPESPSLRRSLGHLRAQVERNPFTATGRLFAMAVGVGVLAVFDDALVGLLSYLLWALVIAFGVGWAVRPKLEIQVVPLSMPHVGEAGAMRVTLHNIGRLPAYDLSLAVLAQEVGSRLGYRMETAEIWIDTLNAGDTTSCSIGYRCLRRGTYQSPHVVVRSYFPFGLFCYVCRKIGSTQIAIAPRLLQSTEVTACEDLAAAPAASSAEHAADRLETVGVPYSSLGDEYIGSREFQAGLAVRRWDFASWARMGRPAVREYAQASEPSVLLVVEAYNQGTSRRQDENFEFALSRAATLVEHLAQEGRHVVLFVAGAELRCAELDASGAEPLMALLAEEPGTDQPTDWQLVLDQVASATAGVQGLDSHVGWLILTHSDDLETRQRVGAAMHSGHSVAILGKGEKSL